MASFSTGTALSTCGFCRVAPFEPEWFGAAEQLDGAAIDHRDQDHEDADRNRAPRKTRARQDHEDERAEQQSEDDGAR